MNTGRLLEGVKIVELSTFIAAPQCAKILGEWGAEVIKVEPLQGEMYRPRGIDNKMPVSDDENPGFDFENSNKKGIALNLKTEKGGKALEDLIAGADVFITNVRTASLEKTGLSYEKLSEKYPSLIFAQILGYGENGPDKDLPGFDFTAFYARGGITASLAEKDGPPLVPVPGLGDHQLAFYLTAGICAALYKKKDTGKGEKITVSLYQAAIYSLGIMVTACQYGNKYPVSRKDVNNPFNNTYQTKDGRWVMLAASDYDRLYGKVMETVGRADLSTNEKYTTLAGIQGNTAEVINILEEQFITKDVDEWLGIFRKADLPFEKCCLWEEILEDEQAWVNGYLRNIKYPSGNTGIGVATPVNFKEMGPIQHEFSPKIGEHTEEILLSIGYSKEEIDTMKNNKDIR